MVMLSPLGRNVMNNVVDLNGNPVNEPEDDANEAEIERMIAGTLKSTADLLLLVWRCYYLVRMDLINKGQGKVTPEIFQDMSQALATMASDEFKVGDVRKDVKAKLMPFLKRMSNMQFNAISAEKNLGGPNGS